MTLLTARRVAVRPDFFAALMMIVGGGAALIGVLLPWKTDSTIPSAVTGWSYVTLVLGSGDGSQTGQLVAAYGVLGTLVAGGACILLGIAAVLPLTHQPLGAVALLLGLAVVGAILWWSQENQRSVGGFGALLSAVGPGWFLAAASGPVILVGAIRALSRSD